ncbi:sugar phosphate isomerase/epimerase and 4-hydroxyphenylpyruvate domain-containing protein [Stutzerimonas stutzeri]|uniref:bifunctional sugar phosphate isomerase/epimerase/4-hydroxyphenylpyruvate dioxygenase family protein n=1 Tax=Stutzerimonas sp. S1 TaxID=3030652 RepID=UPI0022245587|nr:sugar phosphate isomerase/epimerase and 4-hydroxyphenylpyruvate domain-containing protein [Stutzerimonas sp. S1]MCW3149259.1 sugar phosphate isomerase/epimerase and 4-hydroxyphenylpyruvate domain-containing protein [Stutzerimonas sp. S1]
MQPGATPVWLRPNQRGGRWPRAISTVSLSGSLPEKLRAIAAAGFDGVELFESDLLHYAGSPGEVGRLCTELGLAVSLFEPFRDFEGGPRERLQRNLDRAERKFDVMQALGTDLMLVCSNVQADAFSEPEILTADLALLAERASARGLRIGYEALAWGRHVRTWGQAWALVRGADHPALGIVLDSFHTLALRDDPAGIAGIPAEKIFFVQLADAPILPMDVLQWSRHHRCLPGQGEFDLPGFLAPILRSGYRGPLSLEIFNDGLRAAPPRGTAADGLRALLYLEEKTRQHLEREAVPMPASGLFAPPPAARYAGIEFLEFAVDQPHAERLGSWLERLGFARVGEHRSKAVHLYRQGGVNLVLNAEPQSFAHAYFEAHGPSVCAVALQLDQEAPALERACAFHGEPHLGLIGPDEREVPAVHAPDGSLIYLVETGAPGQSLYDADFRLEPQARQPGGLLHIDHLATALPADRLASWVLFYRSLFDFEADAEVIVPDPCGLMRSRVVHSRCNRLRLSLNTSQDCDTAVARALSSYRGAGVHHIAFACADIFAAARQACEAGVPLLQIPRNYYDDLAARFDLDEQLLQALAQYNVLYDRDAQGGELLHLYTEPFEGRFCFELLQRRHGYSGYGSANIAVWLAALAGLRDAVE